MHRQYGKILTRLVTAWAAAHGFAPANAGHTPRAPSGKLFTQMSGSTTVLLAMLPHTSGFERFTFEFGWSRRSRLPDVLPVKCPVPDAAHLEFACDDYLQRIARIGPGGDIWWEVEDLAESRRRIFEPDISDELAEARVVAAFTPAQAFLEQYYLPYLAAFRAAEASRAEPA